MEDQEQVKNVSTGNDGDRNRMGPRSDWKFPHFTPFFDPCLEPIEAYQPSVARSAIYQPERE